MERRLFRNRIIIIQGRNEAIETINPNGRDGGIDIWKISNNKQKNRCGGIKKREGKV